MNMYRGYLGTSIIVAAMALLSACGGGGGGSNGMSDASQGGQSSSSISSASSSVASVFLVPDSPAVSASSNVFLVTGAMSIMSVSIVNPPASAKYIVWDFSSNGINDVNGQWSTPGQATFTIYFKQGVKLAPGTYSDVLKIGLCNVQSCSEPIANSQVTIPVTYKVDGSTSANTPVVTLGQQSINAQSSYLRPLGFNYAQSLDISINLTNFDNTAGMYATANGVAVNTVATSGLLNSRMLNVTLKSPMELGYGTFTSTISLTICLDAFCTYPAPGSPIQIPVTYVVDDTYIVGGDYGYSWNLLSIAANDMTWDSVSQRIFATETGADTHSGYLTRINPVTRNVDWRLPMSVAPYRVQISPDGQYAYIYTLSDYQLQLQSDPRVRKYRLSDQALLWDVSVPGNLSDLKVSSGNGAYLALSSVSVGELLLLNTDDGSMIDSFATTSNFAEAIAWDEMSGKLYSYDATNDVLRNFLPTETSFGFISNTNVDLNLDQAAWSGLQCRNGKLMENHGAIYDLGSSTVISRFNIRTDESFENFKPYSIASVLDTSIGRSFFWYLDGNHVVVQAFDVNTGTSLAYIPTDSRSTFNLIRWGTDGLAYLHSGNSAVDSGIAFIRGKFVAP